MCWVDAWTFARNAEAIERGEGTPQALLRAGQRALESYRGAFLPAEPEDKSIVVMRLKLRDLLARLVSALGRQLEAGGEWEPALACYRRGIDADELATAQLSLDYFEIENVELTSRSTPKRSFTCGSGSTRSWPRTRVRT